MNNGYFNYPLDFGKLTRGQTLQRIPLQESIAQHLHLIITSSLGENLYDSSFGCSIWEYDFDNTVTDIRLRDLIRNSLLAAIGNHELRLTSLDINVVISQAEINSLTISKRVKKRVDIDIKAKLVLTSEEFKYFEYFFLGPLSYY